jgi:hypothetical protein
MKTKELIEKLKELDPKGEAEIYVPHSGGGAIWQVDAPPIRSKTWCEYLDKDGRFVISQHRKCIAIYTLGVDEFISENPDNVGKVVLDLDEDGKKEANEIIDGIVDKKLDS